MAGHSLEVTSGCVSPDGSLIITSSKDATVKVWEFNECIHPLPVLRKAYFDSDGISISADGKYIAVILENDIDLLHFSNAELIHTFKGHTKLVESIRFTPDSKFIISCSHDTSLKIWDVENKKEFHTLLGHEKWVTDCEISFTPGGNKILSCAWDSNLIIWDFDTRKKIKTINTKADLLDCCTISPDGTLIAVGCRKEFSIKIYNALNYKLMHTLIKHTDFIFAVSFSADNKLLVSGSQDKTIKVWNTTNGELVYDFVGHESGIKCAKVFDNFILTCSEKQLKIWNLLDGSLFAVLDNVQFGDIRGNKLAAISASDAFVYSHLLLTHSGIDLNAPLHLTYNNKKNCIIS